MSAGNVVDSKIVELQFNNSNFESNATKSLSTLERLKAALNFSKDTKGFDAISDGVKKVDVGGLTSGVNTLKGALGEIAHIAAFAIIADEAIKAKEAVKGFIEEVTVKQVSAGWDKYAKKTSAVQTIMSATAKDFSNVEEQMAVVNEQLDKLNWFTDETSFNFLDMVNNIGKFTSNQVSLDRSVTAMEGISTWAAKSGAGINEASRAMYNLSQAIAVGSVKLIDWKSIENANMATAEFKETAIQTAVELKLLKDAGDGTFKTLKGHEVSVKNFNEALKDEWFTSDVLLDTLDKYGGFTDKLNNALNSLDYEGTASDFIRYIEEFKSGSLDVEATAKSLNLSTTELKSALTELSDESLDFGLKAFKAAQEAKTFQEAIESVKDAVSTGWMNSFETMFGDYEHAKTLWTNVANDLWAIFASGGEARNEYLREAFQTETAINEQDWEKLSQSGLANPEFIKNIRQAAAEHGAFLSGMGTDEEWLNYALKENLITVEDLNTAYEKLFHTGSEKVNQSIKDQTESLKESDTEFQELFKVLDDNKDIDISKIIFGDGEVAEGAEDVEHALDGMLNKLGLTQDNGGELVTVLKDMGYFGGLTANSFSDMSDAQLESLGWTKQEIDAFRQAADEGKNLDEIIEQINNSHKTGSDLFAEGIHNSLQVIVELLANVREAFDETFDGLSSEGLKELMLDFANGSAKVLEFVKDNEQLKTVFKGVASAANIVLRAINGVFSTIGKVGSAIFDNLGINFLDIAEAIAKSITAIDEFLAKTNIIGRAGEFIANGVGKATKAAKDLVLKFMSLPTVQKNVESFKASFSKAFNNINVITNRAKTGWDSFVKRVKAFGGIKELGVGGVFKAFKENFLDFVSAAPGLDAIKTSFTNLFDDIKEALAGQGVDVDGIIEKFNTFKDRIGVIAGYFITAFGAIKGVAKEAFDEFLNMPLVSTVISSIKGIFKTSDKDGVSFFETAKGKLDNFIETVKSMGGLHLSNFGEVFSSLKDTIYDIFKDFHGFDGIKDAAKNIGKTITGYFVNPEMWSGIKAAAVNVKDTFLKLLKPETFSEGLHNLGTSITDLFGTVSDALTSGDVFTAITGAFSGIWDAINQFLLDNGIDVAAITESVKQAFAQIGENIKTYLKENGIDIDALSESFEKIRDSVIDVFSNIELPKPISDFISLFTGVQEDLVEETDETSEVVKTKADKLKEAIENIKATFAEIEEEAGPIVKALTYVKRAVLIAVAIAGIVKGVQIGKSLLQFFLGYKKAILAVKEAQATELNNRALLEKSGALLLFVLSIIGIIGALKLLETINMEGIWTRLGILALIIGALIGVSYLLGKGPNIGLSALGKGAGVFLLVLSIVAIMGVLKLLENYKLNLEKMKQNIGSIAIVVGSLIGLVALTRLIGPNASKGAGTILALCLAIGVMALAIAGLGALSEEHLRKGVDAVGFITIFLGALLVCSQYAQGAAPAIAALAVTLAIAAIAIAGLAAIPTDKLIASAGALFAVVGALTLFSALTGVFQPAISAVGMMIILLGVVSVCLGILASIPGADNVLPVALAVSAVLLALSVAVGVASVAGAAAPAAIAGMLLMAAFLTAFTAVAWLLGSYLSDSMLNKILRGIDILCQIGEGIGRFFGSVLSGFAAGATSDLAQIADNLVGFIEALEPLSSVELDFFDFAKLGGIIASLAAINGVGFLSGVGSFVTEMITGKTTVEQFGADLDILADAIIKWNGKLGDIEGITFNPGILAKTFEMFGSELLGVIGGGISGIASIATEISENKDAMTMFADDLDILADVIPRWEEATKGIDGKEVNWGVLDQVFVMAGSEAFAAVSGGISGMASLITESAEDMSAMETFTTDLDQLAVAIPKWEEATKNIDGKEVNWGVLDQVFVMASAETMASIAGGVSGLATFVTDAANGMDSMDTFTSDLEKLADAIVKWDAAMENTDGITIDFSKIKEVCDSVTEANIAGSISGITGQITDWITEDDKANMTRFTEDLGVLSGALTDWESAMGNLKITVPTEAIDALVEEVGKIDFTVLAQTIAKKIFQIDAEKSQVETFRDNVNTLADTLNDWKTKTESLGENFTVDTSGIDNLIATIKDVPSASGIVGAIKEFFKGSDAENLEAFAENLEILGGGLKSFTDALGENIDIEKMSGAAEAASILGEIGNALKGQDFGGWFHDSDLTNFSSDLGKVGEGLQTFASYNMDTAKLSEMADAAKNLAIFANNIEGVSINKEDLGMVSSSIDELKTATDKANTIKLSGDLMNSGKISKFKENINSLISAINSTKGMDDSKVADFVSAVDKMSSASIKEVTQETPEVDLSSSAESAGNSYAEGITNSAEAVSGAIQSLSNAALASAMDGASGFGDAGFEMVSHMILGVTQGMSSFVSAIGNTVSAGLSGANEYHDLFVAAGSNLVQGLANGIANNRSAAIEAAAAVARDALARAKAELQVASPSRKMHQVGVFFVEGFVNGIKKTSLRASSAAASLAKDTLDSFNGVTKAVYDILNADIDSDPVIRPVIDLTSVDEGARKLNGIFNKAPRLAIAGNVGYISSNAISNRNAATNADILEALEKLGDRMGSPAGSGNTYYIDGITYDDGTNVSNAVRDLVRAVKVGGRM